MQTDLDRDQVATDLARGGDVVAEALGNVLAVIEDGKIYEHEHRRLVDKARQVIYNWHLLRADRLPRSRSRCRD